MSDADTRQGKLLAELGRTRKDMVVVVVVLIAAVAVLIVITITM